MKCWQYGSRSIWLADRRALPISQIVWHFALEGCANEVLKLKWSQMKPLQELWMSLSLLFSSKGQWLENYSETDTTRVIQRNLNNSMYFNPTHATCRSVPSLNNSEWETSELISIQCETNIRKIFVRAIQTIIFGALVFSYMRKLLVAFYSSHPKLISSADQLGKTPLLAIYDHNSQVMIVDPPALII